MGQAIRSVSMRPRLVYAVTHPVTARTFLRGQLSFMQARGFDVTLITSPGPELEIVRTREDVAVIEVPMLRGLGPREDLASLARMVAALRVVRPHVVNASTPKAGLLGMMAARALRVPARIYQLRGLRLETATGNLRRVLGTTERIAAACAHEVICNGESLRRLAVAGGWIPARKARVLGAGSSNGVDGTRFEVTEEVRRRALDVAATLGIEPDGPNIGFVGRFSADKGIDLLLDAFRQVRDRQPAARLLMVGGDLGDEQAPPELVERVRREEGVISVGRVEDIVTYYALMRVLAFPSLREGFPNVPLEAACAEVPSVGRRTTGVVDAIVDGQTGVVLDRPDAESYAAALEAYLASPELRRTHGRAGRERALRDFAPRVVWARLADEYERLLGQRGWG